MPKLKPGTIFPTLEEEAAIARGIAADPDTYELTEEEWAELKPFVRIGVPPAGEGEERVAIRLSREVVERSRATGPGWQTRVDMPKPKPGTIFPTPEEDEIITAAAMSDPDCPPLTEEEWAEIKPFVRIGVPPAGEGEERVAIRLSREVVERFRATGPGWQTRVDAALWEWLTTHPPAA
jgi:uncharacterized protein (DUF4415 family)